MGGVFRVFPKNTSYVSVSFLVKVPSSRVLVRIPGASLLFSRTGKLLETNMYMGGVALL